MARPDILAGILHKLQRVNALIGSASAANLAADIAAVSALVVVADAAADVLVANVGAAADTNLTTDLVNLETEAGTMLTASA